MLINPKTFTLCTLDRDEILAGLAHRAVALDKELNRLIKVRNAASGDKWHAAKESINMVEGMIARNSDLIKTFNN